MIYPPQQHGEKDGVVCQNDSLGLLLPARGPKCAIFSYCLPLSICICVSVTSALILSRLTNHQREKIIFLTFLIFLNSGVNTESRWGLGHLHINIVYVRLRKVADTILNIKKQNKIIRKDIKKTNNMPLLRAKEQLVDFYWKSPWLHAFHSSWFASPCRGHFCPFFWFSHSIKHFMPFAIKEPWSTYCSSPQAI